MNSRAAQIILAISLTVPTVVLAQAQQITSCHTPESVGGFIGPDETLVNGMVCKIAANGTQSAQKASFFSPKSAQPQPSVSDSGLTNARVIELSKLGLDDEIVIARIRNSKCQFNLADTDIVELKKGGVSPRVIAAMIDASSANPSSATTKADSLGGLKINTTSEDRSYSPGMYVQTSSGPTKIMGQILDSKRSGSLLVSDLTLHIKSSKENVQLLGPHAQTVTGTTPEFYFIPAKQEAEAGVNAGDLILIRLEEKKERRQFEIGAQGAWRASKGVALSHEIQLSRSEFKPGVYKIQPMANLERGEYGLYLSRGEGMAPYIYDFSVQ